MATFNAVNWMYDHGHKGYADKINELRSVRDETIGEAGRYWQFCEFTQKALAKIDAEILEIEQAAQDRYDDWATDPF